MDDSVPLEQQFSITDFQVYAVLTTKKQFNLNEIISLIKKPKQEIKSSLDKFVTLGWLKEVDKEAYVIHLPEILSQTYQKIREFYKNTSAKEIQFIKETSSSLSEATAAANTHIASSMQDLTLETKNLTVALQENISDYLNKYESHRLRTFGLYRINIDIFMRSIKDDFLRNLRVSLGFTPSGEPIFRETPETPEFPSALTIAENITKSRELIKRASTKIEDEYKKMFEEYSTTYREKLLELLERIKDNINSSKDQAIELIKTKVLEFQSFINKQSEAIKVYIKVMNNELNNAREKFLTNIDSQKCIFKNNSSTKTNQFITETKTAVKNNVTLLEDQIKEKIKKELEAKEKIKRKNFDILSLKFRRHLKEYVNDSKEIQKQLEEQNNQITKFLLQMEEKLDKLISNQGKTNNLTLSLKQNSDVNIKSITEEIIDLNDRQLLELHTLKEETANIKDLSKKRRGLINHEIRDIEKKLTTIEKMEKELEDSLWDEYLNHINTIYQTMYSNISDTVLDLIKSIQQANTRLESEIETITMDFIEKIIKILDETKNLVDNNVLRVLTSTIDDINNFEREVTNIQNKIATNLDELLRDIEETISTPVDLISDTVNQLINNHELFISETAMKLREIQENMKLSLTTVLNDLESNLGNEYEELLRYFEQTKETTIGTAKTLLDDMSKLIIKKLDKIWTMVLQELNNLQAQTSSAKLHQYTKNNIIDIKSKIETILANYNKGAELALEMLQNSIKVSFSDLEKEMKKIGGEFENTIKELEDISTTIAKLKLQMEQ